MRELDHHPEPVSLHDCAVCQDRGIEVESREYCQACYCGKRRKNTDAFAEKLRSLPFTDAMWIVAHANIKTERAIAAAELALLKSKLLQKERELAEVRKDAIPTGYALVPVEPTHKMVSAMACSKAIDDEGEFPVLADLLDFSGENKTYTVVRAAYAAAIDAASVAHANKEPKE